ncbi:hypothetical protein K439DRAFT_1631654 [Ramaria rubella]|nr:hypothetical protein K439DRAFT_1631654 [Ramaria rubella]
MFSTLSSLLPAALSDRLEKLDLRSDSATAKMNDVEDDGVKRRDMAEDTHKKEKKKKTTSNETFIVVRPPPAKSNHPLNLQLQLVPAHHSRDRSSASCATTPTATTPMNPFLADSSQTHEINQASTSSPPSPAASETDHVLKRSPSTRSNRSETSAFYASSTASSGSVTSFASTTSSGSARRMIIPLYNLSAHNVMTNTILDAGTDARVARFLKRGLEIVDLAILEPTEVWQGRQPAHGAGVGATSDPLGIPIHRTNSGVSAHSLIPPTPNEARVATPELSTPGSSQASVSDHSSPSTHHSDDTPMNTPVVQTGAKKFFGRVFRKKDSSVHRQTPSVSVTEHPTIPPSPKVIPQLLEPHTPTQVKPTASEVLLPAVLGLSPTLSAATNPPTGRCVSHVWIIRKWLKVERQGMISNVLGKIGREASAHGIGHVGTQDAHEWEVRFEWSRGKSKDEKARKTRRRTSSVRPPSHSASQRNSITLDDAHGPLHLSGAAVVSLDSPRQSLDVRTQSSPRTPSPRRDISKAVSITSSDDDTANGHGDDPGEDSDPEDSETPWTCCMVLTHASAPLTQPASAFSKGHSRRRTMSSSHNLPTTPTPANVHEFIPDGAPAHTPVRLKVATLSPAPHHPKVVCQLKVPYPLPDVEVEHGVLRKRLVLADGTTRSTIPVNGPQMLTMTAEEIKDVVCSTAFWVVVREGFGGVGKKNRKGDGWKIRG